MLTLPRKQIRYWCFRLSNEANGGVKATGDDDQVKTLNMVKNYLEEMPAFSFTGGWSSFGIRWDISENAPFEIIPLEKSLVDKWDECIESKAVYLDPKLYEIHDNPQDIIDPSDISEVIYDIEVNPDGTSSTKITKIRK